MNQKIVEYIWGEIAEAMPSAVEAKTLIKLLNKKVETGFYSDRKILLDLHRNEKPKSDPVISVPEMELPETFITFKVRVSNAK